MTRFTSLAVATAVALGSVRLTDVNRIISPICRAATQATPLAATVRSVKVRPSPATIPTALPAITLTLAKVPATMARAIDDPRVILIRHGQSEANVGLSDDPDCALTALGIEQARQAALRLAQEVDVSQFTLLVSPYKRARQTAELIAKTVGGAFQVHPQIREWGPRCTIDDVLYEQETREQLIERMRAVHHQLRDRRHILVSHAAPIAMLLHVAEGRESQIGDSCFWEGIENCCLIRI